MTQENKTLLLKDLCARLPYGVKCKVVKYSIDGEMLFIRNELELTVDNVKELVTNNMYEIKPYLLPMSSMTEEQREELKREYCNIACDNIKKMFANPDESHMYSSKSSSFQIDWFNKHHIDYRGLIPMDLANDATGLNIY